VEVYDPTTGSWSYLTSLTTRRSGLSAVLLEDKIYVLGGFDGTERWVSSNLVDFLIKNT
jgi:N-acetylneuraminic acid mutarotase